MPSFGGLAAREIDQLVSYVIHLSIRGECEYQTLKEITVKDSDLAAIVEEKPTAEEKLKAVDRAIRREVERQLELIGRRWVKSDKAPLVPDPDPYLEAFEQGRLADPELKEEVLLQSAAEGYKLFNALCTKCHVNYGQKPFYIFDEWGGIVQARNLVVATKRGGREPEAIYARIYGGIPGSTMPNHDNQRPTAEERGVAVLRVMKSLDDMNKQSKDSGRPLNREERLGVLKQMGSPHKIWDLVHFVEYLSDPDKRKLLQKQAGFVLED